MKRETEHKKHQFGFQEVSQEQKYEGVGSIFTRVSSKYDLMNDLMSLGLHRAWKRYFIKQVSLSPNSQICDLAGGTADLTLAMASRIKEQSKIFLVDMNLEMLSVGRDKCIEAGFFSEIEYTVADAASLPFPDNTFDVLTIGFGLRNFVDIPQCLRSIYRVLKPGGTLLVLEFSKPQSQWLKKIYDVYTLQWLPILGRCVSDDPDSYRYLGESIYMHPDQGSLCQLMQDAAFEDCTFENLFQGIVAIHKGYKY